MKPQEEKHPPGGETCGESDWIRIAFDRTFQFTGLLTPEGNLLEVNRTALEFVKAEKSDVVGKPFWETPWWAHSAALRKRVRRAVRAVADGAFVRFEVAFRSKDGEERYLDFSIKPVKDESGRVVFLIPEARDTTERKKVERRLAEYRATLEKRVEERTAELRAINARLEMEIAFRKRSEEILEKEKERFGLLVENVPLGISLIAPDGRVEYLNPEFTRLFGYTLEDIPHGRDWFRKAFPDAAYRKEVIAAWIRDLRGTAPGEIRFRTFTVTCKNGSSKIVDFRSVGLRSGKQLVLYEDVTQRIQAAEELRRSEERYRFLMENAPLGILTTDTAGRIVNTNQKLLEILGSPSADKTRLFNMFTFPPLIRAGIASDFRRCLQERVSITNDRSYTTAGGKSLHLRYHLTPVVEPDGTPGGVLAIVEDFTQAKEVEQALWESKERLDLALRGADLCIWDWDIKRDRLLLEAPEGRLLGYEITGELSSPAWWRERIHADDLAAVRESLANHLQGNTELYEAEFRVRNRQGEWRWILARGKVVSRDARGEPNRALGTFLDITETRRAREAVRESEERFRILFEMFPVAVALTDPKTGRLMDVNRRFCRAVGRPKAELVGRTTRELGFYDAAQRERFLAEIREKGSLMGMEMDFRLPDGSTINTLMYANLIRIGDRELILSAFRDVTEQKRLEGQLRYAQKMEAVGTLAGGVAHDFNNLLQAIQGYTELLLMGRNPEKEGYWELKQIESAARKASELTKQLLAFGRRVESKLRPLRLNELIRNVQTMLERTIPRMIRIETLLAEDLNPVLADAGQIEQVLINLALNARDAMPEGGTLRIETRNMVLDEAFCRLHLGARPGSYVLLTVTDTGVGMDPETLEHIFEPFFTTKGRAKGTGLGLAMCYGIVKSHKGYITCSSEPGQGTTFKIYLPVTHLRPEPHKIEKPVSTAPSGSETILLVDDEEVLRNMGSEILIRFGYTVLTAADGESALEIYKKEKDRIDLVILDLILPGMGGKKCLEELHKFDPKVRVLVASGYSVEFQVPDLLKAGARGFLAKPYQIDRMLQAVRNTLDEKC